MVAGTGHQESTRDKTVDKKPAGFSVLTSHMVVQCGTILGVLAALGTKSTGRVAEGQAGSDL